MEDDNMNWVDWNCGQEIAASFRDGWSHFKYHWTVATVYLNSMIFHTISLFQWLETRSKSQWVPFIVGSNSSFLLSSFSRAPQGERFPQFLVHSFYFLPLFYQLCGQKSLQRPLNGIWCFPSVKIKAKKKISAVFLQHVAYANPEDSAKDSKISMTSLAP